MVFRDYMVRCKRCNIPYKPDNVSRIRTCIFCRKVLIDSRSERLKTLVNDIRKYTATQNCMPTKDIVKTWIRFRFDVEDSTSNSYLKELEESKEISFIDDDCLKRIKLCNPGQQAVNG